jgi:16S rRNA (uracil1498-N3)-methyltransferase
MTRLFVHALSLTVGAQCALPDAALAHVRARRLREGDAITLFDGSGAEFHGTLTSLDRKAAFVTLKTQSKGLGFETPALTLALSVIAADRMDWAIQKACELGVTQIIPILAERSQAPGNAANKVGHWQAIAASAAEQSGRAMVATIAPPVKLAAALDSARLSPKTAQFAPQVWMCDRADASDSIAPTLQEHIAFIGPEGGWTEAERGVLRANHARTLVLSRATLRTETAAVAAAVMLLSAR